MTKYQFTTAVSNKTDETNFDPAEQAAKGVNKMLIS